MSSVYENYDAYPQRCTQRLLTWKEKKGFYLNHLLSLIYFYLNYQRCTQMLILSAARNLSLTFDLGGKKGFFLTTW